MNPETFKMQVQEPKPMVHVIDDFYANPNAVRQLALDTPKHADIRYWKGRRSQMIDPKILEENKKAFEKILGVKIKSVQSHFHVCDVTDPLVYHSDRQRWAGAIYLTPDAPLDCGTSLWRSKGSGLRRAPTEADAQSRGLTLKEMVDLTYGNALLDRTRWDLVDQIGNVYNRCALWRGDLIHSCSGYFGHDDETRRLFQLFFFETEE